MNVKKTNSVAYINCQMWPKNIGKYYFYDNEGYVTISKSNIEKQILVDSRPRGNDKSYIHPHHGLTEDIL